MAGHLIETSRLRLVRAELSDFETLLTLYSDPEVMKFMGGVRSPELTKTILTAQVKHWEEHGFGMYFLEDKESGKKIGAAGVMYLDLDGKTELSMGWLLDKSFHGKGLALEAASALLEKSPFPRITAGTYKQNTPALRLLDKLGFVFVKEMTVTYFGTVHQVVHFEWLRSAKG